MTRQASPTSSADTNRFDRSIRLLTEDGQDQLRNRHVALIGVGGVGSLIAEQLARLGVDTFTIVDPDVVEETNLPRLTGAFDSDIGRRKVAVIRETVERANADATVHAICTEIESQPRLLERADIVIGAVDRMQTRMWLNEAAVRLATPYIDVGSVIDVEDEAVTTMDTYVQYIDPGENGCFTCLGRDDLDAVRRERLQQAGATDEATQRGYVDGSDFEPEPSIITLNGIGASLAAEQVVKHVAGFDSPADFLRYDALANDVVRLHTAPTDDCLVCGHDALLGRGIEDTTIIDG